MKVLVAKKYLTQNIKINVIDLFISTALSSFFGLVFNLSAYVLISLLFGIDYSFINLLYLPVLILIVFLIALGLGMILSISIIFFNDINHIVDIIILLGFWTSGVIFPSENILKLFSPLYYLNPFLGIFQNLRAILVYNTSVDHTILSINLLTGIIIYIIGLNFLNKNYQLANEKF